ncbi:NAD(P)/FAD-dependent oxidoreductase [Hyperthermus butylicus]|uniref:NADH dehydrogenase n=1 Tax=Hyperthermus butylicus (strain DSM 5456 / JCM 9403 / PLM1-5) TaxID=415426 RepID=A2BJM8_HYPBU|nr:FAD-dependent oxidoreductase [Hyperthermus butylicus]ABM80189.1 NADH dehydrogenase [Hyperthermus butylicus DSM 5456]
MTRIVVVGSGFAGVEAVASLSSLCDRYECIWVTARAQMVFLPLLPALAAGRYRVEEVFWSIESYARRAGFAVIEKPVEVLGDGWLVAGGERIDYDYAIAGLGARPAFYGVPGAAEHSITLYSVEDAETIRKLLDRIDGLVIVGAGPVGVELAGEVALWARRVGSPLKIWLIDMLSEPLALLGNQRASELARELLEKLGVELVLGRRVVRVAENHVELEDGSKVGCQGCAIAWTAGIGGPDVKLEKDTALGKAGFILVDETLRAKGYRRLYVAGDAASYQAQCPPLKLAREAIRMARHAVSNLRAGLNGGKPKPYKPFITTCRPLLGVCIGKADCILALGKNIALKTRLPAWYHERVRRAYQSRLVA